MRWESRHDRSKANSKQYLGKANKEFRDRDYADSALVTTERLGGRTEAMIISGRYGTTPGPLWPVSMIVLLVSLRMRSIVSRYMRSRVTDGAFLY